MLSRISKEELESLFIGYGYKPYFVEGADPAVMHQVMAATLDVVVAEIRAIQHDVRSNKAQGIHHQAWPGYTGNSQLEMEQYEVV